MALSGTFYQNVGSYWRIQGEWSASQNISANTSTVTLRTYWMTTRSSYGAIYSSASKSGSSTITGTVDGFTSTAGLSNGQKKLINTQTKTITHNSDGSSPAVSLAVSFGIQVTLSGTYYGTVSDSATVYLNTIPRESTLTTSPSWTAGNNTTISISRASSSFRHEVDIYVKNRSGSWVLIKQRAFTSSQTSLSSSFSTAEVTSIFNILDGRAIADTRLVCDTFNGSTFIGSTLREGTVTAPAASRPTTGYDAYQYTDELIDIPITRASGAFTHTVRFKLGSYTKTITGVTTEVNWTPTASEQNSLNAQMPNDHYRNGSIEVDTFYNGEQVRDTVRSFFQFHVRDANPVFNGSITYADVNSTTTAMTGNNQFIIQNKSLLNVTLSAASVTAQKGASITSFVFMVAGEGQTVPYSTSAITRSFGTINASTNQTIVIEAVDSRGNRSSISKIVTVVPYSSPTLTTSAARINGFEADTILKSSGKFSSITVGGVPKNDIMNLRYRTRIKNGTWGSYVAIPFGGTTSTFSGNDQTVIFDITEAYDVEFSVSDRLGTTTITKSVGVGRPIFFIDDVLGSIAMNDFPKDPNTFLLNGQLTFAGNLYASTGEGGGAIFLNNGDITGANGIWFNDFANNSGEGLLFLKSGAPSGSTNSSDYDNFYIQDAKMHMNNIEFMEVEYGDGAGSLVRIGARGKVVIGAGESSFYVDNYTAALGQTNATEELHLSSDNDIKLWAGTNSGVDGTTPAWRFASDGILYRTHNKETNGYNTATVRADPNHNDAMLIQERVTTMTVSGTESYLDITFPRAFDSTPQWVIAQSKESQSVRYNASVYNVTSSGARVYVRRLDSSTASYTISIQVIACGRAG